MCTNMQIHRKRRQRWRFCTMSVRKEKFSNEHKQINRKPSQKRRTIDAESMLEKVMLTNGNNTKCMPKIDAGISCVKKLKTVLELHQIIDLGRCRGRRARQPVLDLTTFGWCPLIWHARHPGGVRRIQNDSRWRSWATSVWMFKSFGPLELHEYLFFGDRKIG